ncbi:helix-turn-helix domain-containing protein [Hafnia alvei]|nr:helix-turn-helix domain-containing protein [Hafnia alvei]
MEMSDRIRNRRKELKLTQLALAKLVGVNRVTVTGWESGDYQPGGANLQSLALALRCNPLWLMDGKGNPEEDAPISNASKFFGVKEVPVISWVQAGTWTATDKGCTLNDAVEYIHTSAVVSDNAFALRVRGDSMTNPHGVPTIPEGSLVIVEPNFDDLNGIDGKIVVAHLDGGVEATLKKFVNDWPNKYLVPLNPKYKPIECNGNCRIVGIVKQVIMDI